MKREMILKFKDGSCSFAYGVEFGRILEKIERGDLNITNNGFPVRVENKDLIHDTCLKFGYIPVFGNTHFDEWVDFMGIKKTTLNN